MRYKWPRIIVVALAFLLLAGANPFRHIPDETIIPAASQKTAPQLDVASDANSEDIAFIEGALRSEFTPAPTKAPTSAKQQTASSGTKSPSGKNNTSSSDSDAQDDADAPADTPIPAGDENDGESRSDGGIQIASAARNVDAAVPDADSGKDTDEGTQDEPKAAATPKPAKKPSSGSSSGSSGKAETQVVEAKATAHPVLGTVQKTWLYKETALNIRVDKRKIGSNVAFIGTIRGNVNRLHTYTVAGPGQSGAGKYKKTSALAKGVDAAIAINGDCYDYYTRRYSGIVIRDGVVYNNRPYGRWGYAIHDDGRATTSLDYDMGIEELLMEGAQEVFAFGPTLVKDGKFVKPKKENVHPRTAIGRINDSTWVFIVVDGRQSGYSTGMSYKQLANLFIALGCDSAYNLDGGGASTIWLKGYGVLNSPSEGKERSVPDIIYFR